jgi:hypothetical protein
MATDLGLDADWVTDAASRTFPWQRNRRLGLAQSIARRYSTPRDSVPDWPGYGFDLATAVESNMSDARIAMECESQAQREERIETVMVTVRREGAVGITYVGVEIDDGDGPFPFVLELASARLSLVSLMGEAL